MSFAKGQVYHWQGITFELSSPSDAIVGQWLCKNQRGITVRITEAELSKMTLSTVATLVDDDGIDDDLLEEIPHGREYKRGQTYTRGSKTLFLVGRVTLTTNNWTVTIPEGTRVVVTEELLDTMDLVPRPEYAVGQVWLDDFKHYYRPYLSWKYALVEELTTSWRARFLDGPMKGAFTGITKDRLERLRYKGMVEPRPAYAAGQLYRDVRGAKFTLETQAQLSNSGSLGWICQLSIQGYAYPHRKFHLEADLDKMNLVEEAKVCGAFSDGGEHRCVSPAGHCGQMHHCHCEKEW